MSTCLLHFQRRGVLRSIEVRAPPISVFGAPAAPAREAVDSDHEMTNAQIVNNNRVRSYTRMNAHNEADVNVPHKKSKSGKKIVPPRSYPGFSQPGPSASGSKTGRGRGKIPEEAHGEAIKIAVLCFPRTVSPSSPAHHCRLPQGKGGVATRCAVAPAG